MRFVVLILQIQLMLFNEESEKTAVISVYSHPLFSLNVYFNYRLGDPAGSPGDVSEETVT